MSNSIYEANLTRALPPPLKNDKELVALAEIISGELQKSAQMSRLAIIYARIDELPDNILDVLAYDLHVDWYRSDYPIDTKRRIIKDSVKIHKRLGTKFAVERATGNVFPGSKIEEWFEYGGDKYRFRIIVNVTESGVSIGRQNEVIENVRFYKNLRSHLETISYRFETAGKLYVGACQCFGHILEVLPYTSKYIETGGKIYAGASYIFGNTMEVNPIETEV